MTSSESAASRPSRAATPADPSDAPSVRPKARPAGLRRAPMVFRIAMALFCVGGSALLVVLVMFASGTRDFPLWLWLLVALAPVGLLVGAFGVRKAGLSLGP
ncbi:hypothetical protein [Nakamurella lactea]|uniref:hypothetical protein n=1 Tax=Nakamurella lactea TaxID=459515 RepID=UPI0004246D59|nr:hypothetical protein [Nakamurella lactea]